MVNLVYNIKMKKEIKYYTCRGCKLDFSAPIRQGRDPQYCSDKCRGVKQGPTVWTLTCKTCKKDWSLVRTNNGGRKPHFCPDCYESSNKERHKQRLKERDRSYAPKNKGDDKFKKEEFINDMEKTILAYEHEPEVIRVNEYNYEFFINNFGEHIIEVSKELEKIYKFKIKYIESLLNQIQTMGEIRNDT